MVWLEKEILGRRSVKDIFAQNKRGKREIGMGNWDGSNDLYGKDVF